MGDRCSDPLLVLEVERRESARGGFTHAHARQPARPALHGAVLAGRPAARRRHRARRRGAGHRRGRPVPRAPPAQGRLDPRAAARRRGLAPAPAVRRRRRSLLGDARSLAERHPRAAAPPHARSVLRRRRFPPALRAVPRQHRRAITPSSADCSGTPARWPPSAAPSPGPADADRRPGRRRARCCTTSASSRRIAGTGAFETTDVGTAARARDARHAHARPPRGWRRPSRPAPRASSTFLQHLIASHHGQPRVRRGRCRP